MDKNLVYLVQTDTTVGFSSNDDEKLSSIKNRPATQKMLQTVDSFATLKKFARVPKKFRKIVRRSSKTTFIYPNFKSFRVISKDEKFHLFIEKFQNLYSTSANITGKNFDEIYAYKKSDIVVYEKEDFNEVQSSSIYRVNNSKIIKLR